MFEQLRLYESQNVTLIDSDGRWPMVWDRARGMQVWDPAGRSYLDLTAGFGVAAAGHAPRKVVAAGARQMKRLLHAMGDVHPHPLKAVLARRLSELTFERWTRPEVRSGRAIAAAVRGKTIFCNSGFEAVEAALKTAFLATGKPRVLAFTGGYHGLGYGALNATHRPYFRFPFRPQLAEFASFLPFPARAGDLPGLEKCVQRICRGKNFGAILVEPMQVRGGIQVPPDPLLPLLRNLCSELGMLLIVDEIYTGFGRTGRWFACEHSHTVPDLICLGKALTGGFPLSACVGRSDVMDLAWPRSRGEALHTSTFLGHPVGCAMALAQIELLTRERLCERAESMGAYLLRQLERVKIPGRFKGTIRGKGLLVGLELASARGKPAGKSVFALVKEMLAAGFILLPEGEHGNVIGFTPPLIITRRQIDAALEALEVALAAVRS